MEAKGFAFRGLRVFGFGVSGFLGWECCPKNGESIGTDNGS